MKILVLTSTFPRWEKDSVPPFVYELSKRLARNLDVFVLAPYSKGAKRYEEIDHMKIFRFNYWPFKNKWADGAMLPNLKNNPFYWFQVPFFLLFEFLALKRISKKHQITIIHAHWIIPQGLIAVIYKKLFNKKAKILCTTHGADIFGLQSFNFVKKWVLNNCTKLTVVSNAIKNEALKIGSKTDIEVLPMGVDLIKFSPKNYNPAIKHAHHIKGTFLLFVGRLTEKKGLKYLINAMPEIIKEFPRIKLVIVGGGEKEENLIALTNKKNLQKNVIFTGPIQNNKLPEYYATADIFIGPSLIAKSGDREGFGLVFVEAIGSGCLTIATDLPAISDIIINEKTGFIVKQRNSKQISETVIKILKNKKSYDKIKINARNYVLKKFDWELIAKKYGDILNSM